MDSSYAQARNNLGLFDCTYMNETTGIDGQTWSRCVIESIFQNCYFDVVEWTLYIYIFR